MLLAHDISGTGAPVLLLHSTATDRRMWDPQVPALTEAGRQVIRCDLRGYGESPIPQDLQWDDAADVASLLDALGITSTAVIASSGGGRVALSFTALHPARVSSLALLCTALRGHSPSPALREFGEREDALLEAGDVEGATSLNVEFWLGPEAGSDVRAAMGVMQRNAFEVQLAASPSESSSSEAAQVADSVAEPDLSVITAPTLLVSGAHDVVDFHDIAVHLAKVLPHARHVELPWAGHLPSMERPDLINPLLIDFLAESH